MTALGQLLSTSRVAKVAELVVVLAVALAAITIALPLVGNNALARQAVAWVANVVMLCVVWLGLRVRGQSWEYFGLGLRFAGWRSVGKAVLQSFLVLIAAAAAFVLGSIVMANITGVPESADMTRYEYLRGNLPMLILALIGVYLVSSLGEEVIYRAFLITRVAELGAHSSWAVRSAVAISALVFGLVHFDWGPMGIVQTGFMGLALGISYLVLRRRLWVLVLAHAYMDTLLLVPLYLPRG
ncbi:MAG TPA: CPBP family intramembrane glutamic endopeptidase [Gemmatimonadales bacterium]